jgi:predicted metal-dependent enzyme (double-stranded beta helix superfamily)
MSFDLDQFVTQCDAASRAEDAQSRVAALLQEAVEAPQELADALSGYSNLRSLEDLAVFRSDRLTLLHGLIPPGFTAAPHNHNVWSVVAIYDGEEQNIFFEREGDGLVETGRASVTAPGVLCNAPEAIHSIHNPRNTTLRAIHAYGGDLFTTPRSSWDAETHEETAFDWRRVSGE